jgi:hypothetical protein
MKTMEQHDLVKEELAPTCLRAEFVRSDSSEDDDQISAKI